MGGPWKDWTVTERKKVIDFVQANPDKTHMEIATEAERSMNRTATAIYKQIGHLAAEGVIERRQRRNTLRPPRSGGHQPKTVKNDGRALTRLLYLLNDARRSDAWDELFTRAVETVDSVYNQIDQLRDEHDELFGEVMQFRTQRDHDMMDHMDEIDEALKSEMHVDRELKRPQT